MTSNVGARLITDSKANLGFQGHKEDDKEKTAEKDNQDVRELVLAELKKLFRPEFLNRLDETILFKPLTKSNISGIINLLVDDLNKRLADKEISIRLTDAAKQHIVENGYDPVYGARPLKRYMQKYVETLSAKLILEDKVKPKDTIVIDEKDGELTAYCESFA